MTITMEREERGDNEGRVTKWGRGLVASGAVVQTMTHVR